MKCIKFQVKAQIVLHEDVWVTLKSKNGIKFSLMKCEREHKPITYLQYLFFKYILHQD